MNKKKIGISLVGLALLFGIGTSFSPAQAKTTAPVTKLVFIVEENHTAAQVKSGMPYLTSLANQYGQATHMTATTHPSLPNYIEYESGSTHGKTKDTDPGHAPVHGQSVFGNAVANGKTAHVYADEQTTNCELFNDKKTHYLVRHAGLPYMVDERALCNKVDTNTNTLAADIANNALANIVWHIPAQDHDAHAPYTLAQADAYLKLWIPKYLASDDFKSGKEAIVITFDEGVGSNQNIEAVVLQVGLSGKVVTTALNEVDMYHWMLRVGGDVGGTDFGTAFGL